MSVHLEIYEAPGFLDDCFRSILWTKFQSASSESFENANDVSGDYATMAVTEGGVVNGCGWRRDISGLNLDTDDYPLIRVRLRGRGTLPQYKVDVEYTDTTVTSSGWVYATSDFLVKMIQLTSGKTIKYLKLYSRSNQASGTGYIDYDYAAVLKNPPLEPNELHELTADLVTTSAVSSLRFNIVNDPLLGVTERRYSLDENLGTIAYDQSKNRHQSGFNATWNTGKHGNCLYFNAGSSCRLNTGWKPAIGANDCITIAFWVKAAPGVSNIIAGIGMTAGAWRRIQLNWSSDKVRLYVRDDSSNVVQYTTISTLADNTWHHLVAIVDPRNDIIKVYVDGELDGSTAGTLGTITLTTNDLTFGCLHNSGGYSNYTSCHVDEIRIISRELTADEVSDLYVYEPMSGAARVAPGNLVMAYVAADSESLVYKLITARVIDRVAYGDPDAHMLELVCEDLGEVMHERTFSGEYTGASQISSIVDDILDTLPEIYQEKDSTNRTIVNKFNQEGVWSLLEKLAQTATFATGETGANFFVDPGGAFRFKKYGVFNCSHDITDGSDGGTPNILDIQVKESIKGHPRLVNEVKVIVFEEENIPSDQDALTESAEGWCSPDPTDMGYPQSDTGDKYKGTSSIHFNTTNPGTVYRMRLNSTEVDLTGIDKLVFMLKYGAAFNITDFTVKLWRNSGWVTDYYVKTGVLKGASASWVEYSIDISDFTKTGSPGPIIETVQIQANHGVEIGVGGFLVDNLRFVRDEKAGLDSDNLSQTRYGKRTLRVVDKTITDTGYAGYVAENILAHRKEPIVNVRVRVPGRGQLGYRPPMQVNLTSLKDGIDGETFQIVRVIHTVSPGNGYECELDLIAAKDSSGVYVAKIAPAFEDVGMSLATMRRIQREGAMNSLRNVWK